MSKVDTIRFSLTAKNQKLGHLSRGQFDVVFGLMSKIFGEMVGAKNLQWSAQPSHIPQNFDSLLKKVLRMFLIT
jgi:hypothetical protein